MQLKRDSARALPATSSGQLLRVCFFFFLASPKSGLLRRKCNTCFQKRVTGEAYVNTHSTETRDLAVRTLHGRMMGQRWIEVSWVLFVCLFGVVLVFVIIYVPVVMLAGVFSATRLRCNVLSLCMIVLLHVVASCLFVATTPSLVVTAHALSVQTCLFQVFRASGEDFERAMQRRIAVMSSDTRDGRDADVKVLNLVSYRSKKADAIDRVSNGQSLKRHCQTYVYMYNPIHTRNKNTLKMQRGWLCCRPC